MNILVYQSFGFLAIIALCWLDEWIGLCSLLFGDHPFIADFRESALKMLLVLAVWLLVAGSTRRVLARLHHLESFIRVCSWCRRVHLGGHWVDLEQFLERSFKTSASHGICEDCLAKQQAEVGKLKPAETDCGQAQCAPPPPQT